ncbi:undecaprenyldiphospho-muramoylpentapeptide beta-N-acetylglucosaminyltransferase [Candidatus Margulisiibacteriota bacterium]
MKVVIAGGGTGGHIYPGIAIAKALQTVNIKTQILFIGSEEGIEKNILPKERLSLVTIKSRGMLRKLSYKAVSAPFVLVAGFIQSLKVLKTFKPDAVVVTGGYVSLPVALAAFVRRIPILLHEENLKPGLSTRIIKWIARVVTTSFEGTKKYLKFKKRVYCFGNPVREAVIKTLRGVAIQNLGYKQNDRIVLIMGGSQGARSINQTIIDALPLFEGMNIQILHVSGERDHEWIRGQNLGSRHLFYRLVPYMHNLADGLAAADLVVSRAGATAISEIAVRGIPSILIPFPFSSGRHQDLNAKLMADAGASHIIWNKDLNAKVLVEEIKHILNNKDLREFMGNSARGLGRPDAAEGIVKMIYNITGQDEMLTRRKGRKVKIDKEKH